MWPLIGPELNVARYEDADVRALSNAKGGMHGEFALDDLTPRLRSLLSGRVSDTLRQRAVGSLIVFGIVGDNGDDGGETNRAREASEMIVCGVGKTRRTGRI